MTEIFSIFLNVVLPVFGVVVIGCLLGGRMQLQASTLTRTAYYVFVPAFIFQAISTANIQLDIAVKMVSFVVITHLAAILVAGGIGRGLGRPKKKIAAFVMIASFGNVGNYGLAMIRFHLGEAATVPATLYFVAITIVAFVVCVGAAGWAQGGSKGALWGVLKTPALWALPPALLVSMSDFTVPLMLTRMIGLLADAMIPVMLFALGLQLLEQRRVSLSADVWLASGIRLLLAPAFACAFALLFALKPIEMAAGVLQAGMPTAILVAIIAKENNIIPDFVTSVVIVSTLASLVSLTILMVLF